MKLPEDITFIKSPNYQEGREGFKPIAICLHVAEGTKQGVIDWFTSKNTPINERVSAHFLVGKDGSITQFVSSSDTAWANGVRNNDTWGMLKLPAYRFVNPNLITISIEHEGWNYQRATAAQLTSSLQLSAYLCNYWKITPKPLETIIGHFQIDGVNRKNCPGMMVNIVDYTKSLTELLKDTNKEVIIPTTEEWYEGFKVADSITSGTKFNMGHAVAEVETTQNVTVQRQQGEKGRYCYTIDDRTLWVEVKQ